MSEAGPHRLAHLGPQDVSRWTSAGYSANHVISFQAALTAALQHPNLASDGRFPSAAALRSAIGRAAVDAIAGRLQPAAAAARLGDDVAALYIGYNLTQLQYMYRESIGYTAGLNHPPAPPAAPSALDSTRGSDDTSSVVAMAVSIPVGVALLAGIAACLLVHQWYRTGRWKSMSDEGTSVWLTEARQDLTLCVTDVQVRAGGFQNMYRA